MNQNDAGLYRDDGLIAVKNLNGKQTDKLKKNMVTVFQNFGFKIEIKTNLIEFDFFDVLFNLIKGTFRTYKKPNINLSYINAFSNHPPNISKRLPNPINDLLSRNSSSNKKF